MQLELLNNKEKRGLAAKIDKNCGYNLAQVLKILYRRSLFPSLDSL
jgi:hypothetical protein